MTDITQTPDSYPEGVYQLAVTDPVLGGPEGPDNKAAIALANRTAYQRMRNVTPWRTGIENQYPAHAYVQHAGTTWKSKIANANVEPGTDAGKWIRWSFTEDELLAFLNAYIDSGPLDRYALDTDLSAYLLISQFDSYVFNKGIRYSATVCPNGGPSLAPMNIAAPTLAAPYNVYKSALGEVWMYLDNTWRVIAGSYFLSNTYPDLVPDYTATSLGSFTAHRAGTVMATLHGYISVPTNAPIQAHELTLGVLLNGVFFNAHRHEQSAGNASDVVGAIVAALPVSAGDVITFFVEKVSLWDASLLQSVVTYKD